MGENLFLNKMIMICIIFSLGVTSFAYTQPLPDSLKILYNAAKTDSAKGKCLSIYMDTFNGDSSSWKNVVDLIGYFKKNNDQVGEDYVQLFTSFNLTQTGQFNTALNQSLQILSRFEERHDNYGIINAYLRIGDALYFSREFEQCIVYCKKAMPLALLSGDKKILSQIYNDIGSAYNEMNKPDSGLIYAQKAVDSDYERNDFWRLSISVSTLGESYIAKKEYDKAIPLIKKSARIAKAIDNYHTLSWDLNDLAQIFLETNQQDSARYYAHMAVELSTDYGFKDQVLRAYEYLYKSYEITDTKDSVYKYFRLSIDTKDSLYTTQKAKDMQTFSFREQIRQQEIEQDKIQLQNKIRTYGLIAGIVVLLLIAFLLFINNRNRKKANKLLQKQKDEIEVQKKNVEETLNELKSTQTLLIHSEKMASLGELTAGIAHEIKNPLNFVNNFSEVSNELVDEIKELLQKENNKEGLGIVKDLKQNLEKINQHGKRADSIVKGMLLHSRGTSGEKTPTDINDLLEQYVNLAYHGMRAQNKEFNITIEKDYDGTLEKINVVPQDISRVFLNIINNACYASYDKKKKGENNFSPILRVSTKNLKDKVEIRIGDNGNGIPKDILDKIFQPFFTTKPTGEGTGLGLSLSYDIVTKVHEGELKVETKEGEGTEFIIILSKS